MQYCNPIHRTNWEAHIRVELLALFYDVAATCQATAGKQHLEEGVSIP